jgi:predicted SAM-dependent methyltransferase
MGGWLSRPGWVTVNISPTANPSGQGASAAVDVVAPMDDLRMFGDGSVTAIYASHVLEHAAYGQPRHNTAPGRSTRRDDGNSDGDGDNNDNQGDDDDDDDDASDELRWAERAALFAARKARLGLFSGGEVAAALDEWARVLLPGGALFLAVPNLDALASLYVNATLSAADKVFVMRMIYGGQVDAHDFHRVGFDEQVLAQLLAACGFCEVRRVRSFGLFEDTSEKEFRGVPISLNVAATACKGTLDGRPMSDENRIFVNVPGR